MTKPIYSPFYGDSKDIGYISIFIGKREGLYPQVEKYHKNLKQQKIPHNFFVEKEMFHVYVIFNMIEGQKALIKIVQIIKG
ncbi:hypothetical protein FACS1894218_2460 [Bacilli bacterium]|nr:hypothetical protein FACS1894218_2460 [Bacilli bacterium]